MDLERYLSEKAALVNGRLDKLLPDEDRLARSLARAMRYSVFAGGKRLRPVLVMASFDAVAPASATPNGAVINTACAFECIHTYSLIHDDLPAIDNDELRRGRPTCHKLFGEAGAILAGDALLTIAFALVAAPAPEAMMAPKKAVTPPAEAVTAPEAMMAPKKAVTVPEAMMAPKKAVTAPEASAARLRVIHELAEAAGAAGMIGGQVMDIESEGKEINTALLEHIHIHKTGALILAAVRCGAILAGATCDELAGLTRYGEAVGLAFQITDDVLDVEGSTELLGKRTGGDEKMNKATYPALYGLSESKAIARELTDKALEALEGFDERAEPLRAIAAHIVERRQ